MGLAKVLRVGLKEWAVVCRAMEEGRQIVLLRKGGIYEAGGEFEVEHGEFLLFPTYLHQNAKMVKEAERGKVEGRVEEPGEVRFSAAGAVTDVVRLSSRKQMEAIEEEHIWTKELIDMRFNYRPENPLYLLLVRVYRLAEAVSVENTIEYGGCKSWVPLEKEVKTAGARAAVGDEEYESRRWGVLEKIGDGRK